MGFSLKCPKCGSSNVVTNGVKRYCLSCGYKWEEAKQQEKEYEKKVYKDVVWFRWEHPNTLTLRYHVGPPESPQPKEEEITPIDVIKTHEEVFADVYFNGELMSFSMTFKPPVSIRIDVASKVAEIRGM